MTTLPAVRGLRRTLTAVARTCSPSVPPGPGRRPHLRGERGLTVAAPGHIAGSHMDESTAWSDRGGEGRQALAAVLFVQPDGRARADRRRWRRRCCTYVGASPAARRVGNSDYKPTKRGGGGALEVLWWQGATLLNPHFAVGTKDQDGSRIFYEPLAGWDPDGNLYPGPGAPRSRAARTAGCRGRRQVGDLEAQAAA